MRERAPDSYTRADVHWARWIDWQLRDAGYETILDQYDFRPGHNFALAMQAALEKADRLIAVLSPAYFASGFGNAEWRNEMKAALLRYSLIRIEERRHRRPSPGAAGDARRLGPRTARDLPPRGVSIHQSALPL